MYLIVVYSITLVVAVGCIAVKRHAARLSGSPRVVTQRRLYSVLAVTLSMVILSIGSTILKFWPSPTFEAIVMASWFLGFAVGMGIWLKRRVTCPKCGSSDARIDASSSDQLEYIECKACGFREPTGAEIGSSS